MQLNSLRKTHPVVLIVAVAITVFSLLVSAAISGLIPGASFVKPYLGIKASMEQPAVKRVATLSMKEVMKEVSDAENITADILAMDLIENDTSTYIPDYKSRIQPSAQISPVLERSACGNCGKIVSINDSTPDSTNGQQENTSGYVIKILMGNGSYRTITQYSEPHFNVGDEVRVSSRSFTRA